MEVVYLKQFLKDIQKLNDAKVKNEILHQISSFKKADSIEDILQVKKLRGHSEAYRLLIGKYRLGFYYDGEIIQFARFAKREDIYKLFP
jgi:mRNA-degrading endonuclease RelE of RelBE toxin-antitoxin system